MKSYRSRTFSGWLAALAAYGTVQCGAGSIGPGRGFDINFPDNRADEIAQIAQRISTRVPPPVTAYVVLAPQRPARGLTVFALPDGRRLWQTGLQIDSRPVALGDLIVAHAGASNLVGFDAASGRERWRQPDHGYSLIGAARDGNAVAVSMGPGSLNRREGIFWILDAASGSVRLERQVEQALGSPAATGGYAFVPWNGQYLSVLDIGRGDEVARIRSGDDVFSRATSEGGAVYFGSRSLFRLGRESGRGTREGTPTYALPRQDLPGEPTLMLDGYVACICGVNARERVAAVFRPDPSQPGVRLIDGVLYILFHRVVFALEATNGNVRWAYNNDADIAGAQAVRGGIVFVDERGNAGMLNAAHGQLTWRQALGTTAAQAVLQLPIDFAPPTNGDEAAQAPENTLLAAAGGTDNRMLPARIFAARSLSTVAGPGATRALLEIAGRQSNPPELRAAAGEALSRRTEGSDALLAALETHFNYVRQTGTPPVGFIARSLAAAHERRGVAALIAHLQDPETPATELPPLVRALREFGDASAVPALLDFLRLYHADDGNVPPMGGGEPVNDRQAPEQEALNAAMEQAVQTVSQLGGPRERRWLQAMADDTNTIDAVRTVLNRVLSGAPGSDGGGTGAATAGGAGAAGTPANGGADTNPDPNLPPSRLSMDMIREAFQPAQAEFLRCLDGSPTRPGQLRIQFRYDSEGRIASPVVTPPQFGPCITPIALRVHLPPSQVGREIGTYYVLGGSQ